MPQTPIQISLEASSATPSRDDDVMVRFRFGRHDGADTTAADCNVALEPLLGQRLVEVWRHPGPHQRLREDAVAITRNADYTLFALELGVAPGAMERVAAQAYETLLDAIGRHGGQPIVKAWNIIPAINQGVGDDEIYKQFCVGRSRAFEQFGINEQSIPAGTGVGSAAGSPLQVFVLTAASAPRPIENPRQISAYHYPRQYGPRSPTFARAALLNGARTSQLFLSGTAAIIGHESQSPGDPASQAQTTSANLRALVATACQNAAPPLAGALRVYVRHPEDAPTAYAAARELVAAEQSVLVLQADICRHELLIEIDGIAYFANEH